jgi:exodeoxyribonuclease VIII
MTDKEYFASDAISASMIKTARQSLAHYYHEYVRPNRQPKQPTPAMILGTVLHTAFLEPEKLSDTVMVVPDGIDKRTKTGKDWYTEAEQSGKILIKHDDMQEILSAVRSARSNPLISDLYDSISLVETPIFWNGFKAKPDAIIEPCDAYPNGAIIDLKSTVSASCIDFTNQAYKLGYHIQAAHYCDGFMHEYIKDDLLKADPPKFIFLAIEKTAPYLSQLFECSKTMLEVGITERNKLWNKIQRSYKSGEWEGYSDKIEKLDLPKWVKTGHESNDDNEVNELF